MLQAASKTLTLAEFLQLPETKPASEYFDGQILLKSMPQGKHSLIQGEFVPAIDGIVKSQRIARAFPELHCTLGERSTVPDIAVFLWNRIPLVMRRGRSPTHFLQRQIGQLKSYRLIKAKPK